MILYMYIAPGLGLTTPEDKILKSTETSFLSLRSFATSFKNISLKSDFIQFFSCYAFIHVCSPRAGSHNPWGQNFDVNRNILSLRSFVASFKNISLKSDFIQFVS